MNTVRHPNCSLLMMTQEKTGMTEDDMFGWHRQLDGHEFEQAPGVSDRQEAWRAVVHGVAKSRTQLSD